MMRQPPLDGLCYLCFAFRTNTPKIFKNIWKNQNVHRIFASDLQIKVCSNHFTEPQHPIILLPFSNQHRDSIILPGSPTGANVVHLMGRSGGNGRPNQLAERFGFCEPFAERESVSQAS